MTIYLTIDTGTTNTRVSVWRDEAVIARSATPVGVRNTAITGQKTTLQNAVRDTIGAALMQADLLPHQVDMAIASGMITSSLGLHELAHLTAPVDQRSLTRAMVCVDLPEIFSQPIWFIRGVRNAEAPAGPHQLEMIDMMRGEEVEVMGLIKRLALRGKALIVMPGSHSKYIAVDAAQRITGCVSTLAGELLQAITQNTILSATLEHDFSNEIDPKYLLAGAELASREGLARACFSVRTLKMFMDTEREACANFLLGAVLGTDLLAVKNSRVLKVDPETPIVIAGTPILRQALEILFRADEFFTGPMLTVDDQQQADLAGFGATLIASGSDTK